MNELLLRNQLKLIPESGAQKQQAHQLHRRAGYCGCCDARLDPVSDIKIEQGEAFIERPPGAVVLPQDDSVGLMLELLLDSPPLDEVKHFIIAVHTDCAVLKACRDGCGDDKPHTKRYLKRLDEVRTKVMGKAEAQGWTGDKERILKELEKESLLQSIDNVLALPVVQKAIAEGKLKVHGWLLDTATRAIYAMNPETREFELWVTMQEAAKGLNVSSNGR